MFNHFSISNRVVGIVNHLTKTINYHLIINYLGNSWCARLLKSIFRIWPVGNYTTITTSHQSLGYVILANHFKFSSKEQELWWFWDWAHAWYGYEKRLSQSSFSTPPFFAFAPQFEHIPLPHIQSKYWSIVPKNLHISLHQLVSTNI